MRERDNMKERTGLLGRTRTLDDSINPLQMGDESINFQPPFKPNDDSDGTEDEEEAVDIQLEPPRRKSRKLKKEDDPVT